MQIENTFYVQKHFIYICIRRVDFLKRIRIREHLCNDVPSLLCQSLFTDL